MAKLMGIFGRKSDTGDAKGFTHPIAPQQPFLAIGDVHGRVDLVEKLEQIILTNAPGLPAVFVGDYIDRGENSAQVLELMMSASEEGNQPVFCLRGNHEEMCLNFLDNPIDNGERWLKFGGLQTLSSYGVSMAGTDPMSMQRMRDALALAMGDRVIDWLRARPVHWSSGNIHVTHAGADPARPIPDQPTRNLTWGHKNFAEKARTDGQWVVYGHVIVDQPKAAMGRIAVDTGAYATGRLTAALIADGKVRFLTT
ncbi:metallophosphoesterase [Thalassobius vesicularis]|nr:metallophosphoesterase [Thalassobius vesicularis]